MLYIFYKKTTRSVNVGFPSETGDYTGASLKTGPPLSSQKIGYKLHVRGPPPQGLNLAGSQDAMACACRRNVQFNREAFQSYLKLKRKNKRNKQRIKIE